MRSTPQVEPAFGPVTAPATGPAALAVTVPAGTESEASEPVARPAGGSKRSRLAWVDMARGACVLAVVLMHVSVFHVDALLGGEAGDVAVRAARVVDESLLAELRMPLLLFISGWLASSKIRAGLGEARTRVAIASNLYLFALWTVIFAALEVLVAPGEQRAFVSYSETLPLLVQHLLYPSFGPLWFVWVLGVGTFALALMRRWPHWLVVAAFTALGYAALFATGDIAGAPRAVFFALGALVGGRLIAALDRPRVVAAAAVITIVGVPVVAAFPHEVTYLGSVALGLPVALACLAFMRLLSRWSVLRVPLAWVGRRTVGVFILHWPLVGALAFIGAAHPLWFSWLHSRPVVLVYPFAVTLAIAAVCIALQSLAERCGLRWLFFLPTRLRRRIERSAPQQVSVSQGA